jgi:hypothetical protein
MILTAADGTVPHNGELRREVLHRKFEAFEFEMLGRSGISRPLPDRKHYTWVISYKSLELALCFDGTCRDHMFHAAASLRDSTPFLNFWQTPIQEASCPQYHLKIEGRLKKYLKVASI